MTIGDRIKRFRTQRGWTLRDLAKLSRVDHGWICRVETGERSNISLEAATRVAQALGVSLDYLAGLTRDPTPRPHRPRVATDSTEQAGVAEIDEYPQSLLARRAATKAVSDAC